VIFLHRDDFIVVVDKPAGVLVHRGMAPDRDVMMTRVRDAIGRHVYPVHRLDRGTSGALVFALDPDTARAMMHAFADGAVHKTYLALLRGHAPESIVVDHPVPKSEHGPRVPAVTELRRLWASDVDRGGREAAGDPAARMDRCSWVEARPRTGRFHQIRRHAKHLSHPVIGDVTYGDGRINRRFREIANLHRLALHAREIAFAHPNTGAELRVASPLPADLRAVLTALGAPQP
jgi:tRNA pseudouridine65 synthase